MGLTLFISLLGIVSVAMLTMSIGAYAINRVTSVVTRQEANHETALRALFRSDIQPRNITYIVLIGAAIIGLLLDLVTGSHLGALGAAIICLLLPKPIFAYLRRKRLKAFEERLPVGLDILASAAKAGMSLRQAIDEVSKNAPPPVNEEFGIIQRDLQLGSTVPASIGSTRSRLQSRIFDLVSTALLVNEDKGGNLPEALVQMSLSLKEIWRLEQKLITASAEGRKAIWVISLVPIFVFLLTLAMQPDLLEQLTSSLLGLTISAAALLLYVGGIYLLIRILRIDI